MNQDSDGSNHSPISSDEMNRPNTADVRRSERRAAHDSIGSITEEGLPPNTLSRGLKDRSGRGFLPTLHTDPESMRRSSSMFVPQFPSSAGAQVPMMFYNPYMQYPLMPGQNFPMQGFLPPQMMMPPSDVNLASAGISNRRGGRQEHMRSSKDTTDGDVVEEESNDNTNLAMQAVQEQQKMMSQWVAANFPGGPMMGGDEYMRNDEYTNPQSAALLSNGMNPFYAGMSTIPSPSFLAPNVNWPTSGAQRGSQEQS
jgi:hypothetical protein